MSQTPIETLLELAVKHHRAGQFQEAERGYRQVLTQHPDHPGAIYMLGMLAHQVGRNEIAEGLLKRAIMLQPAWPDAHSNLGNVLKVMGQTEQAIDSFRKALALAPNSFAIHSNLGAALRDKGKFDEAIAALRRAIELCPSIAELYQNLGTTLRENGEYEQAIIAHQQAVTLKPTYAEAYVDLAANLRETGKLDDAIAACHKAIAINPALREAYGNLGVCLRDKGQNDLAVKAYRAALNISPDYAIAHSNLGAVLFESGHLDEAIAAYNQAIALRPDFDEAHNNLGSAFREQGRIEEAVAAYQKAVSLSPTAPKFDSNLMFALHLHPGYDAAAIAAEHRRWNNQHAEPLATVIRPHTNDHNPRRRLRIGYVSPDLRDHVVGRSLLPLLLHRDRNQFEIFCYAKVVHPDARTQELKELSDAWRNIVGVPDETIAELIRHDQIDILVDLALHTAGNLLMVFARKPAPIQITYLGYCSTTGLTTMDYRFSDRFLDPSGTDLSLYSEQTVFLEKSYWCYVPPENSPDPSDLPAETSGSITFGCLNNFSKVSVAVLEVWTQILRSVLNSKLLLYAQSGSHRQRTVDYFVGTGIASDRIEFVAAQSVVDYLSTYHRIDIALDPFPYTGGITSCDSLWMGVPFVTLAGDESPVSRGGCSVLGTVGFNEFIAENTDQYISIAVQAANDQPGLVRLRKSLRARMQQSPLMDAKQLTLNIEVEYRRMWHTWCETVSI